MEYPNTNQRFKYNLKRLFSMAQKGILTIIYDNGGSNYYLILHNQDRWGFLKTLVKGSETEEQALERLIKVATGLKDINIIRKLDKEFEIETNGNSYLISVYLIESNMNIPVVLHNNFNNYLWGKYDRVAEKLSEKEKEILDYTMGNSE